MQKKLYWKPSVYHTPDRCGQILRCPRIREKRKGLPALGSRTGKPGYRPQNRHEE
jgi:hypothetical protein